MHADPDAQGRAEMEREQAADDRWARRLLRDDPDLFHALTDPRQEPLLILLGEAHQ